MNSEARHELELLEALSADAHATQRGLSAKIGIALGLTNIYIKRLVRKGYVKCLNARSNRVMYLVTPTGILEKTRLTFEFMEYSLTLYRQSRLLLKEALEPLAGSANGRVAIYGTGEAAELAYISLRELGIEPVAVFDEPSGGRFLSVPVRPVPDVRLVAFDRIIVATLGDPAPIVRILEGLDVPAEKIVTLRPAQTAP
jgi:hypothetical protein